jgi:hypothetical protein
MEGDFIRKRYRELPEKVEEIISQPPPLAED